MSITDIITSMTTDFVQPLAFFAILLIANFVGFKVILSHRSVNRLKKKNDFGERFASQSKPIVGGILFMASVALGFLYAGCLTDEQPDFVLLFCCALAFGMGCFDDLKNKSPLFKLVFQLICSVIFIANGVHIATSDNIFLNYALTICWVVGLMNSINMLDNMDGITATTSLLIFSGLAVLANGNDTAILLSIIASLAIFLIWNWHPAKVYMGDNGSQLLGVLLAYFGIKYVWNSADSVIGFNYEQITFVALMFLVPLTDTVTVAINRFLGGKSPFVGDRYHTTHCLVHIGMNVPKAVLLLDAFSLVGVSLAVYFIACANGKLTVLESVVLISFTTIYFTSQYLMNLFIRKKNNLLYHHD